MVLKLFKQGIKKNWFYLEGQFGSYSVGDLVDDLRVKAATVVHVSHHDRKKLNKKRAEHLCHSSYIKENINVR